MHRLAAGAEPRHLKPHVPTVILWGRNMSQRSHHGCCQQKRPRRYAEASLRIKVKGGLFRAFAFFLSDDFFAGFLINDFHRQANLAAIVKAQQLDFHFLTFLQNI